MQEIIAEIQSAIEEMEKDASLYEEKNFDSRIEALDFIDFRIIDPLENLPQKTGHADKLILLKHRAEKIKTGLEGVDTALFQKLREKIRVADYRGNAFKDLVNEYVDFDVNHNQHHEEAGYDNLDIFINELFPPLPMPEPTKDLEPEMVFYQKTPARIVFELVEKAHFATNDVFFDLGSGLGQVAILVNLLAGVIVKGIEFEPVFCDYARDCAAILNLSNVSFINIDARLADYSHGTIFFMFTPFRGEILQEVLAVLRKESLRRKIKIITYGPCTALVAQQSWLNCAVPAENHLYKLCVFISFKD